MGRLHPSFPTILFDDEDQSCRLGSSMARWIYATWIISWRAAKLAASPPPPAMPHRLVGRVKVGRVKRDRPARAGSRGAAARPGVMPVALTEHGATLQAGAQRILDAVKAARDDVAAVYGQIRGTVSLGTTLHTGPLDLPCVLANVRDRHPDVVIKLHQPKDGSVGSCNRSATGQWISPYALAPPNKSPISRAWSRSPAFA